MVVLQFKYVNGQTAAFTINGELYFLKIGPDLPRLWDRNLRLQLIPNLDHWFQAQTQQRYSYRGIQDMMEAFLAGLSHSYTSSDFEQICERVFEESRNVILRSQHTRDYARAYRIEMLSPKDVYKVIQQLTKNFNEYLAKQGRPKFYNYLCRLWQFCTFHQTSEVPAVERLIARLELAPREPEYPIPEAEVEAKRQVVRQVVGIKVPRFKGVQPDLAEIVDGIQAGRL